MKNTLALFTLLSLAGCVNLVPMSTSPIHFTPKGDGSTDCTAAFQKALDATGNAGGGIVFVPAGTFRINGTLTIPDNVTLEGVNRAPVRGVTPDKGGTVLLAFAGKDSLEGPPFILMNENSVLKGLTIFYPEQIKANPPLPYPWTIQGAGKDNVTLLDLTLINPYQAVDLGTKPSGRHLIRNLYAYPLFKGLYINQCYDVGRIENIHFWPFWDIDPNSPLWVFTQENAEAFIIGKTDGEMANNLFSIFYKVGMHFIDGPIGDAQGKITSFAAGSGMYTNCYIDVTPCAILVDAVMDTAGVSFVNGSFMSNIVVGPKNRGPVKFTGCGFWATRHLASHASLEGRGAVFFESCHFNNWDRAEQGAPCIDANNKRLLVTGCDFPTNREDHQLIRLGPHLRSAVITSNLMPGGQHITNHAPENADIQIGLNATAPKPNYVEEWLLLAGFPNEEIPNAPADTITRRGFDTDYLSEVGGESKAILTPSTQVTYRGETGVSHTLKTQTVQADDRHILDIHEICPGDYQVAYAFTFLYSESEQTGYFELGMNDGGKVFINGEEAFHRFSPPGMQCKPGTDLFEAPLKKGWNPVLLKIENGKGAWEFIFEAYDANGENLHSALTAR